MTNAFGGCTTIDDDSIDPIQIGDVRNFIESTDENPDILLLVDPRSQNDYTFAHLPEARNIGLTDLRDDRTATKDSRIARHENIVVYGDNPGTTIARAMAKKLIKLDYDGVRLYFGGMEEWTRAGLPVERGPQPDPWFTPDP